MGTGECGKLKVKSLHIISVEASNTVQLNPKSFIKPRCETLIMYDMDELNVFIF